MKLQYFGKVSEFGEMSIYQKSKMVKDLEMFKDSDIVITIEKKVKKISNKQRGYWYAVILPFLKKGYESIGYNYTLKQVEDKANDMFLYEEIVTDEGIETKQLDFTQPINQKVFNNAVDRAKMFGAENLNVYIPDANETIKPT